MECNKDKLEKNPQILTRIVDSNAIAILLSDDYDEALKREAYIFNDTGTVIWELINGELNTEDIAKKISLEYEITLQEAEECVKKFVQKLAERRLINYP